MPGSTVSRDAVGSHLTVVVCAAGPASDVDVVIQAAHAAGWTANVIATPAAVPFLDLAVVAALTGAPVRVEPRDPDTPRATNSEPSNAILVAPATFNTINKLATGIADNYALTILAEAIGNRTPVVVVPFVNSALASRHAYQHSLKVLREEGVRIIQGEEDQWLPHPSGTGEARQQVFPWRQGFKDVRVLVADPARTLQGESADTYSS